MDRNEIAWRTEAGLNIYTRSSDGTMVYSCLPSYLEPYYIGKVLTDSELLECIGQGEVFETSDSILVNSGNGLLTYSKDSLFRGALEVILEEVEKLQDIENFSMLRVSQKKRLVEFLKEGIYNMTEDVKLIRIPIFATYRYNDQDCIPQDELSQYVEISFSSPAWRFFLDKIRIDQMLCESTYVYSLLVKHMIGKQIL